MKYYLLETLKELALLGGFVNKIEVSSKELASQIKVSQQTASRYILELDELGLISREIGVKKQLIEVTDKGRSVLEREYLDYKKIFEFREKLFFTGKVISGFGEGSYYTGQNGYIDQFEQKLGFEPFPGTLNVEIKPVERNKLRLLKSYDGIIIESFETEDRTFGEVFCFKAEIEGVEGAIVLPARGHYSNVLEFVSPHCLREKLGLEDEDQVDIVIFLDETFLD
ncbi:MAG: DUF120 domain-containing protein [Candidatus Thermoplasmatota archaeon]